MTTSRVRATYTRRATSCASTSATPGATDWGTGFGEMLTAVGATTARSRTCGYSQPSSPHGERAVQLRGRHQLLNEIYDSTRFNTSAVRNVYSPEVTTPRRADDRPARQGDGEGPVPVPAQFLRDARMRAVLDKVAQAGNWGRAMPAGTAQGVAVHREYKGFCACLVEIDCRPATVEPQDPERLHGAARDEGRVRGGRGPADQPARPRGADDGRDHGRDRAGAHLQPAPQGRRFPRGQLGRRLLHAPVEHAAATSR